MIKVVCFKWNNIGGYELPSIGGIGKYTALHVNAMHESLKRQLTIPFEFICITDDPTGVNCKTLPLWDKCREFGGCYNRLYVFSKDMKDIIGERFVCIDLDCVITGNLDALLSREDDFLINVFYGRQNNQYYNGGFFMITAGARDYVWTEFEKDIPGNVELMTKKREERELIGTDQAWISYTLGRGESIVDYTDGIYAFSKLSTKKGKRELPNDAIMVLFAGTGDPSTLYYKLSWIRKHWGEGTEDGDIRDSLDKLHRHRSMAMMIHDRLGYAPDLTYPRTLSEKLTWKKINVRDERMVEMADKVMVKEYLLSHSSKQVRDAVIPNLYVGNANIPFDDLPDSFIVKANNASGRNMIVKDKNKENLKQVVAKCERWLTKDYGKEKEEWFYSQIRPRILVEPLIDNPKDYKFFMFNGKCVYINVIVKGEKKKVDYWPDWTPVTEFLSSMNVLVVGEMEPKPDNFNKMIWLAEKLSEGFDFVRVDLYNDKKIYFSELTFFPTSGWTTYLPRSYDLYFGKKLQLDDSNNIKKQDTPDARNRS